MSKDKKREKEAAEWAEATFKDIARKGVRSGGLTLILR
jgi:hypothetical protein